MKMSLHFPSWTTSNDYKIHSSEAITYILYPEFGAECSVRLLVSDQMASWPQHKSTNLRCNTSDLQYRKWQSSVFLITQLQSPLYCTFTPLASKVLI